MRKKNLYKAKYKPYGKALAAPVFHSHRYNPCGAVGTWSPSSDGPDLGNSYNTDCFSHYGAGHDAGFCCDMKMRLKVTMPWMDGEWYPTYYNVLGGAPNSDTHCEGCSLNSWTSHSSGSGNCWSTTDEPCLGPCPYPWATFYNNASWRYYWSQCRPASGLPIQGCTNPHSFGIITDTTTLSESTNAGCPNPTSQCTQNCMMLTQDYYNEVTAGKYADVRVQAFTLNGFDVKSVFDCEPMSTDYQNPSVAGAKLIFAGAEPNTSKYQNHPAVAVDGVSYGLGDGTSTYAYWRGYRNMNWTAANAHGQRDNTTPTNANSHLWKRRSQFKIDSPNRYATDFDSCCTYQSFGCTDPLFGNFDSAASLNCAGLPKDNTLETNGDCLDYQGNPQPLEYCYEDTLNCNVCIDQNTGEYDSGQPDCTTQIWNACGGNGGSTFSGELLQSAWNLMYANRPFSYLYGDGKFWTKGGTQLTTSFLPQCQCLNTGCMNPAYGPTINITDCEGLEPGDAGSAYPDLLLHPFGNERCCTWQESGCPDTSSDNYFCKIEGFGQPGVPQNQAWCMDPTTGENCANIPTPPGCSTTSPFFGGVPLDNVATAGNVNNGVVQLLDDGSCDINIQIGCNDNGVGFTALYPGISALNYDSSVTTNNPAACVYALACTSVVATNVVAGTPYCIDSIAGSDTMTSQAIADAIGTLYGISINATFVEDNIVPNPTCCIYPFGGGLGCTDPSALNFDPTATILDPNACLYATEGCTDPNAINFILLPPDNLPPLIDDGSCIYSIDDPAEGTNFLDGSEILLCMDPLTKEEVLMNVCEPPEIQSEVFIERGTQTVFEPNQRLGEINTIGGLEIYGYGFYNIKKQI